MAAEELRISVSKEKYETQIAILETKVKQLQSKADDLDNLKRDAASVFGDDDDSLAKAQAAVDAQIRNVNSAISACQGSIETLQKMLKSYEDIGSNIGTLLDEATEAAAKLFL